MRALVVGLIGGGVLVAILWWIGFGEPALEEEAPLGIAATDDVTARDPGGATLEGRATAAAAHAETLELTGTAVVRAQVLDAGGQPLGGVSVELRAIQRHDRFTWRPSKQARDAFKPPADLKLLDTRPSRSDGWVAFRGLDARRGYEVRAMPEAPYFGAKASVWPGRTTVPPVLVLGEGVPLKVRVVDAEGAGVKAWVSAAVLQEPDHRGWNQLNAWSLPKTSTQPDGRLILPAVPETVLVFSVFVPGRGSRNGIEIAPPFEKEVVLAFEHAGGPVIQGTVRDSTAQPVRGAQLIATLNPQGANGWQTRYTRVAQTGSDGRYRIAGLPAGYLASLNVHATGYIYVQSAAPMMELADGQQVDVDVTLYRGGVIEGSVRDAKGNAIPSARVIATIPGQSYWNSRGTTATSDEAGRFRIEDVPLGKGQLGAHADGFYMEVPEGVKVRNWQAPPGPLYEVKAEGERLTVDVVLAPGVRVEGTVVDPSDNPVVGARVWAHGNLRQRIQAFDQYATQRMTDAEGRFEYLGLPPGDVWRFNASTSEGRAKQVSATLSKDKVPEPLRLVLKPLGGIRGRLDTGSRRLTRPMAVSIRRKHGGAWTVSTRADGGFEQRNLNAGTYEVYASDGLGRRIGTAVSVEVTDGAIVDDVTLAVEALQHVMGRVVDLDGEPVPSIQVRLHYKNAGGKNQTNNTNTRLDGRFAWRDLLDGDYEVQIADDKTRHGVRPGDDEQKFIYVVPPKDIVEGTVLAPDGTPVAGGNVSIRRVRKPGSWNGSGAQIVNGRFRGEAPRGEGTIDVAIDHVQDAFGRRLNTLPYLYESWTITTGPLEIKLEAGYKLAGRVVDPSGKGMPHVGVHIQAERRDGRKWYGYYYRNYNTSLRTDAEGRFEQLGLREGRYEVYAQPAGDWMQPEPVVAESGTESVLIAIQRGLSIEGRVVDSEGVGVAAVPIQYGWKVKDDRNRNRNLSRSTKTDANGAFRLGGLPADAVGTLSANPARGGEKNHIRKSLPSVSAGETQLVLTLETGGYFEGRVQGPSGESLSRMRVRVDSHDGRRWVSRYSTKSKSDGTFKLGPVPAGLFRVRVDARGEYSASEPMEMRGPASDVVIEVPKGQPVKGKVLGENVKGFQATWYFRNANGGWQSKNTSVQTNGSFLINQPTDEVGTLLVRRKGDDRYALLEDVRPSHGPFELDLVPGRSIRGYVTGLPESWRWANVYARTSTGISLWGRLQRDGTFEIRGVPGGTYTITGHMSPGRIGQKQDVAAGASDVELEYTR